MNTRKLTPREHEVVQLAGEGHSRKETAARMSITVHTVHAHRRNIKLKLNLGTQGELMLYALREGIATL